MHAQASTREEYHVTVEGDPFQWRGYCVGANIKPLWIELNNFERQIMCAITPKNLEDDCCDLDAFVKDISRRFTVVRVKKEVQPARSRRLDVRKSRRVHLLTACHPERDLLRVPREVGRQVQPRLRRASRDLFRAERWYVTKRQREPFNPDDFARLIANMVSYDSKFVAFEYEAAILDTNPELDARWMPLTPVVSSTVVAPWRTHASL
jgi:hypothetical protein